MSSRLGIIVASLALHLAACSSSPAPPARPAEPRTVASAPSTPAPATSTASPVSDAPAPLKKGLLPAGLCWFHPYLDSACSEYEKPHFAVVLAEFEVRPNGRGRLYLGDLPARPAPSLALVERALQEARAQHTYGPGYPFVASYDDLRRLDQKRQGLAIVAGLFAERAEADTYVRELRLEQGVSIVELAPESWLPCESDEYDKCEAKHVVAVEVAAKSVALSDAQLDAIEKKLAEEGLHEAEEVAKRRRELTSRATPVCEVARGQVFAATSLELYSTSRDYAPITCPDGRRAWIPWRNTRLESVVVATARGPIISQVVAVSCDSPTLDERPYLEDEAPPPVPAPVSAGCRG